jgi:hypothetical protein
MLLMLDIHDDGEFAAAAAVAAPGLCPLVMSLVCWCLQGHTCPDPR